MRNEAMEVETSQSGVGNDLAHSKVSWLVWRLPTALILAGMFWPDAYFWLWMPAFLLAGIACVVNAARCSRLHCYFTGPIFLLAAAYLVAAENHIVPINLTWFLSVIALGIVLAYLPEWLWGKKYLKSA